MAISDNITVATFLPSSFPDSLIERMLDDSEQVLAALFDSEEYKRSEQTLEALLRQAQADTEQALEALLSQAREQEEQFLHLLGGQK